MEPAGCRDEAGWNPKLSTKTTPKTEKNKLGKPSEPRAWEADGYSGNQSRPRAPEEKKQPCMERKPEAHLDADPVFKYSRVQAFRFHLGHVVDKLTLGLLTAGSSRVSEYSSA